ncbi:MAG: phosphate ABC transporter permease PstA [Verrucomicrobiota bacterium]
MSEKQSSGFDHSMRPAGEMYVWLCSMGLAAGIILVLGLLAVIVVNGFVVFWPRAVYEIKLKPGHEVAGQSVLAASIVEDNEKKIPGDDGEPANEYKLFTGNKDVYGAQFRYVDHSAIEDRTKPEEIFVAERIGSGNAIFYPVKLTLADGQTISADSVEFLPKLEALIDDAAKVRKQAKSLDRGPIGRYAYKLKRLYLEKELLKKKNPTEAKALQSMDDLWGDLNKNKDSFDAEQTAEIRKQYEEYPGKGTVFAELASIHENEKSLDDEYAPVLAESAALKDSVEHDLITYRLVDGTEREQPIGAILKVYQPNQFSVWDKIGYFISHFWMFLSEQPREANTEGGVFPAIFGTFVMTVLMSAAVMPFGVLAAIYLREYAGQGPFTQSVRIAVNNLAGVPSIVYGVFGLGFFIYFVGSNLDQWLFSDRLLINEPTFGTGGVMWASLTLALMTVPVVVVATEEALAAVPRGMREASLACGASKWQTIQRVVLPASASGILTGLILAMARGAGEVAPLMLVGVIKYAPDLPVDGTFPFIHLERKFMHLGFHIYDLGFQSPDSEAAKPMVFATTFLLIMLVVILNLAAILIRDHLRKKYASGTF